MREESISPAALLGGTREVMACDPIALQSNVWLLWECSYTACTSEIILPMPDAAHIPRALHPRFRRMIQSINVPSSLEPQGESASAAIKYCIDASQTLDIKSNVSCTTSFNMGTPNQTSCSNNLVHNIISVGVSTRTSFFSPHSCASIQSPQ